jgi:hypothetical protein
MSSSAITGLSGIAPALPSLAIATVQTAAKPQTTPTASNGVQQPLLMVPTKPPLSAAVMAELIGQQTSPYGSPVRSYSANQNPIAGIPPADTSQGSPSLV